YLGNQGTAAAAEPGAEPVVRPTDPVYAQDSTTAFSDGFPILLATEAALDDLNKRLAESDGAATMAGLLPLPMARFRPNIILKGTEAWEEDRWRSVLLHPRVKAAGSTKPDVAGAEMADVVELESVKPCSRCKMTTVDPATGSYSQGEPLDILATFRSGSQLGYTTKGFKYAVHFGWNLVPSQGALGAIISVGDAASFKDTQRSF
ncbi:MOSC domain-containing protein, partial [Haematococcus lacustris]